jgi:hypothetical protein
VQEVPGSNPGIPTNLMVPRPLTGRGFALGLRR